MSSGHGTFSADPNEAAPRDRYNLAYSFLLLHGVGFLLPWNVFINAKEYYVDYKLNTTISHDADYRNNFMSYIGFAAHFPSLCFAAWNTFYQSGTKSSNPVLRFLVAMSIEIVVLLFTIIFTMIDTSHFPGVFFGLTIASVVLINCCVGIHQTLTFGMAAALPMKYSNAVIVGSNACGTIISIVNLLTKWLAIVQGQTPHSIVIAAIAYFLAAVAIIVACLISFFWLRRLPFVRHHVEPGHAICIPVNGSSRTFTDSGATLGDRGSSTLMGGSAAGDSLPVTHGSLNRRIDRNGTNGELSDVAETQSLLDAVDRPTMEHTEKHLEASVCRNCFGICCLRSPLGRERCRAYWERYILCLRECWPHCLNVWCVFFCSLAIFPAVQSKVQLNDPDYFIPSTWFPDVTCFLFFNLFAMLGCIVCNWIRFPGPKYLFIFIWARLFIFIPFFLFCNFGLKHPNLPVLVTNDHIYVLACVVFGFTNGYFASLAMMYASRDSPPERVELAGMLAAFFLVLGVCSGVYTSRALVGIL